MENEKKKNQGKRGEEKTQQTHTNTYIYKIARHERRKTKKECGLFGI